MSRHLAVVPEPLPECVMCERPTRRDTFDRLGGLCSDCTAGIAAITIGMGPRGARPVGTDT